MLHCHINKNVNHIDKVVNDAGLTGLNTVHLDKDNSVIGENTDVLDFKQRTSKN